MKIIVFACNWCSYAGADLAGVSRTTYPENVRIVRVMCSGMVNPAWIIYALRRGFDGVIVAGCHPGECHYTVGNYHAKKKFEVLKSLLDFIGFEDERLRLVWISASESKKFAEEMTSFLEEIKKIGKNTKLGGD